MAKGNDILIPLHIEKGLFTEVPLTQIPIGGCGQVSDMTIRKKHLTARPGFGTLYDDLGGNLQAYLLDRYIELDGTKHVMCLALDSVTAIVTVHHWTAGGPWVDITGAVVLAGALDDIPHSTTFGNRWYFTTGGNNNVYSWNGAGNIAAVGVGDSAPHPNPKVVISTIDRLFLMNIEDGTGDRIPYRIDWSDWLDGSVFNNTGSARFLDLMDEADPITTAGILRDNVVVFKDRYTYVGSYANQPYFMRFQKVSDGIGCIAPRSLVSFKDNLLFLGNDANVYIMSAPNSIQPLAMNIRSQLQDQCNELFLQRSVGVFDKENWIYNLFIPKTATSDLIAWFMLNLQDQSWTEGEIVNPSILPVTAMSYPSDAAYWTQFMVLGSTDGDFYELAFNYEDDDGTAFIPEWTSGIIDIYEASEGKVEIMQLFKVIVEAADGQAIVSAVCGDFVNDFKSGETLGTLHFDDAHKNYLDSRLVGRYFIIHIATPYDDDWPSISRVNLVFTPTRGEGR